MRWGERRFYSLDYYLKETFGCRLYKLALNGGMTCPNRDGTLGTSGCIFCSAGGSGEFAASALLSIPEQLTAAKQQIAAKTAGPYIAYFQAYTNTYAPVAYLQQIYEAAMAPPEVRVLSVATRPDCLGEEVLALLAACNRRKPVWVELGLQTIHQHTADWMHRGYALACFDEAVAALHARGIKVIAHVILGLPGETREDVLETIAHLNACQVDGVKLQLLHVISGTGLAAEYAAGRFETLDEDAYVSLVVDCLEALSPQIVVHRLTGDGEATQLVAPYWSLHKKQVLNQIGHALKSRNTFQGRLVCPAEEES